jgi:hypothetical protein
LVARVDVAFLNFQNVLRAETSDAAARAENRLRDEMLADVRFGSLADIQVLNYDACFAPKADVMRLGLGVRKVPSADIRIIKTAEFNNCAGPAPRARRLPA